MVWTGVGKKKIKAASAFSGGVAHKGESCGAIIGAILALGLVTGREMMEDEAAYMEAIEMAGELRDRFMEELVAQFGFQDGLESTLCRHIQEKVYGRSFDLTTEEGRQVFLDAGGHSETGCPLVCGIAAQVAAEKIMELE